MTKLLSLVCAAVALALCAWSLAVSAGARQTLETADAAYGGGARRLPPAATATAAALPTPEPADEPERHAGPPVILAPLGVPSPYPNPGPRPGEEAAAAADPGVALAPEPTAPAPSPDRPTLGYTLPASHTAGENSLGPN